MPCSCTNGRNPSLDKPEPDTDQDKPDSEANTESDDEAEFKDILKVETRWKKSKVSQFEQTDTSVSLFIKNRSGWEIWQYPLPRWNQYLAWKQQREEEAEFLLILNLQDSGAECTIQQYQFKEQTAELVLNYGTTVGVWQYPESYWHRYLAWKQARSVH
jgi:hypothetical protein